MKPKVIYLTQVVALATVYVVAARIGLTVYAVAGFATLVWPASGIALAALLIVGGRLWPGVFVGAVVANMLTGAPLLVAFGIGIGNTMEPVLGAYVLRRLIGFHTALDRVPDVLGLVALAAVASTTISATGGVASLVLGGIAPLTRAGEIWRAWWLGDLIGILLVAPVLLVWTTSPYPSPPMYSRFGRRPWPWLESVALGASVATVSVLIFGRAASEISTFREAYLFFPVLIWAVLRFGQLGGVTTTFVISFVAVWGTVLGHGPFVRPALYQSLLALQIFMGVTAVTFLVLGASVSERWRAVGDLEQAVIEQKRLHAKAADANRVKSEFMAVMSHELRTPLNAIAGYVDLLQMGIHGSLTAEQESDLERIRRSERSLRRLVEDVLSFAKLEAGVAQYRLADVSLDEAMAHIEPLVSPQLRAKGLTYRCMTAGADVTAWVDPEKLEQILLNLVSNAIKFTSAGRVELRCEADTSEARVVVTDTGSGIPVEIRDSIFEPFVQGDGALTRTTEGTGLGLAISRQLARAMGGDIAVESWVGVGSTFTLRLPKKAPRVEMNPPPF